MDDTTGATHIRLDLEEDDPGEDIPDVRNDPVDEEVETATAAPGEQRVSPKREDNE
jgi:hypothetical protein